MDRINEKYNFTSFREDNFLVEGGTFGLWHERVDETPH